MQIGGGYLLSNGLWGIPQVQQPNHLKGKHLRLSQSAFTCSQLIIETLEQGVKYVQS